MYSKTNINTNIGIPSQKFKGELAENQSMLTSLLLDPNWIIPHGLGLPNGKPNKQIEKNKARTIS